MLPFPLCGRRFPFVQRDPRVKLFDPGNFRAQQFFNTSNECLNRILSNKTIFPPYFCSNNEHPTPLLLYKNLDTGHLKSKAHFRFTHRYNASPLQKRHLFERYLSLIISTKQNFPILKMCARWAIVVKTFCRDGAA